MQLDALERGFSFRGDAPLDMRMDRSQGPTAADLLREVSEGDLADVIFEYGEERHSRRIARALVRARDEGPLDDHRRGSPTWCAAPCRTAASSASTRRRAPSRRCGSGSTASSKASSASCATRCCGCAPARAWSSIAFHSLEDRIVKHTLRGLDREAGFVRVLTQRPEVAGDDEVELQPARTQRQAARRRARCA